MRKALICLLTLTPVLARPAEPADPAKPREVQVIPPSALRVKDSAVVANPYPVLAEVCRVQGKVKARILVGPEGAVKAAKAMEGPMMLRKAAERILLAYTFAPVEVEGKPILAASEFEFPFVLDPKEIGDTDAPATGFILKVEAPGVAQGGRETAALLEKNLRPWLEGHGLVSRDPAKADRARTLEVTLRLKGSSPSGAADGQSLDGRISLMADRSMDENLPGKGLRVWYFHRYMAQKDAEGLNPCALAALEALQDALVPGERTQVPPVPGQGAAPADVEFQQVKVQFQPPAPNYPAEAKLERIQGTVTVELVVDPTGVPRWATAIDGPKVLMETACQYALNWRFQPATVNGVPQSARFRLPMPFKLR